MNRFARHKDSKRSEETLNMVIRAGGRIVAVHSDDYDFRSLGTPQIRRASHVEPDEFGQWTADLSPVGGPKLGPFSKRSEAIQAEQQWLKQNLSTLRNESKNES